MLCSIIIIASLIFTAQPTAHTTTTTHALSTLTRLARITHKKLKFQFWFHEEERSSLLDSCCLSIVRTHTASATREHTFISSQS
uniref:Putative secreted protein n=1 Tax=Anopheles marajoara TaxID=58244 RepID=A0A2M4CB94_9DIPT